MDFSILLVFWAGFGLALLSPGPNFAMLLDWYCARYFRPQTG